MVVKGNATLASGSPLKVTTEIMRELLKTTPQETGGTPLGSVSAAAVDVALVSPSPESTVFTTEEDF